MIEQILITRDGLIGIPEKEIYYYGPKKVCCQEVKRIKFKEYMFDIYKYDINGNGIRNIEILDLEGNRLLKNLNINVLYNWVSNTIEISNDQHPNSSRYFKLAGIAGFSFESIIKKLYLMTIKEQKHINNISFQYLYAYIIFLFLQIDKKGIKATQFSNIYSLLKKVKFCISQELSDNVGIPFFSKDTIYFKVFDRYLNRQIENIKSSVILYD